MNIREWITILRRYFYFRACDLMLVIHVVNARRIRSAMAKRGIVSEITKAVKPTIVLIVTR